MRVVYLLMFSAIFSVRAADTSANPPHALEPNVDALTGVWQPDKNSLTELRQRSSEPQMIELIK